MRFGSMLCCVVWHVAAICAVSSAQSLSIFNPDFELDTAVAPVPNGWTAGSGTMYVTTGVGLSPVDPTSAFSGTNFITANRLAPNPDATFPAAQSMSVFQNLDLTALAPQIDLGDRSLQLNFAYNDADADDNGIVSLSFFDASAMPLGSTAIFQTNAQPTASGGWSTMSLLGAVPVGARSARISLAAERASDSGTARNVSYDSLSAELITGTPATPARDVVHGNLIQFTDNGAWSWFQDERAIVDADRGKLLVGSIANRDGPGGQVADGWVKTTIFDFHTGSRNTTEHKDLESYGAGDDHNVPAYLKLPNGNYLAFYAPHNNVTNNGPNGSDGGSQIERYSSYYRIYDTTTNAWGPEHEYDWQAVMPDNAPGEGGTTYSNLFHLSAENGGNGRIYNIARTQQSPHIMYSDDNGATWQYGGQLTKQADNPPSNSYVNGYFKYWSNGVDRIDFIATEFHPRDYNTSVYHGYIQGEKMYDSTGQSIDADIFDTSESFSADLVPAPDAFTQIFPAGTAANSRAWTTDVQSYPDGSISALFKARAGGFAAHTVGANDHRVWFARFDPATGEWNCTEIAKAGGQLFGGSETDYTGLGALHPNDPNTIYISTEIDPTTNTSLPHHEIYRGVTGDQGATWTWTAITKNSSYDNLRPIVPAWDADNTALLWWRGSMDTSHDFDTTVVGILDRKHEVLGKVTYFDATADNTTLGDGAPLALTGPATSDGPDDDVWHVKSGVGNGGNIFTADETDSESAPLIRTRLTATEAGEFDVFAFFWTDINQDWRIQAGLSPENLMLFRVRGSQQAELEQFAAEPIVDSGNMSLYRGYLGRVEVDAGETIDVYVDDSSGGATQRAWYDGIGLARIAAAGVAGDYNNDGAVDAADYTVWRNHVGTNFELPNDPIGGTIGDAQYRQWKSNFGTSPPAEPAIGPNDPEPLPEPATFLIAACGWVLLLRRRPAHSPLKHRQ